MNRRLRPPPRSKPRAVPEYVPPPRPPASGAQAAFRGKIDSVRTLAVVLRCVAFRPKCVVTANSEGLFFTVDDARCARARAYFPEKLFRRWTFADGTAGPAEVGPDGEELRPELRFEINLFTLMECLNIYGTALSGSAAAGDGAAGASRQSVPGDGRGGPSKEARTTPLEIWFESSEKKLCLALQDQGVATHCKLATFDPDLSFAGSDDEPAPELDVVFNANTDIRHKIVMPSSRLDDAFKELDPTAEKITFAIQSEEPYFRMSADGVTGSTEIDFPKDTEVMEKFYCNRDSRFSYPMGQITPALKSLSSATRTNIRTNDDGFLCLQNLILFSDTQHSFVEFFLSPLEDEEEEAGAEMNGLHLGDEANGA